jgi:hypothetical protein
MSYLPILAATVGRHSSSANRGGDTAVFGTVDYCWTKIASLTWVEAVIVIAFGLILLFHGWRIYKTLVVISFAMIGLFLGKLIGDKAGAPLWGAVVGMVAMGFISIPLMQWAISILGAIAGGALTASFWYAAEMPDKYILAGALIGVIAGGMISFIVVRAAVTLFTSLQGAILVVLGTLALLAAWDPIATKIESIYYDQKWFVPALLTVITAAGIYIQMKFNKGGGDGGGGGKK